MKKFPILLTLSIATLSSALAQTAPAIRAEGALRQFQSTNQRRALTPKLSPSFSDGELAPELYPGESADVGPQLLMLEQTPAVKRTWFEAYVDTQYLYTSNTFLTEKGNDDTGLLITTAQFAFAPTPFDVAGGQLTVRSGYRQQRYMYGLDDTSNQLNNFDFDVGTVFLNARYTFAQNWTAFLSFDYNRLLSNQDNFNEFYVEALPAWGIERQIQIGNNQLLSLVYVGAYHFTHTDPAPSTNIEDRLDSILSLTWSWQILPGVVLQPFYRFQYTHYWVNTDRNDFYNTLGAGLSWQINNWASIRAFSTWEGRTSDDFLVQDYQKFDTGGGASITLVF